MKKKTKRQKLLPQTEAERIAAAEKRAAEQAAEAEESCRTAAAAQQDDAAEQAAAAQQDDAAEQVLLNRPNQKNSIFHQF